MQGCTTKLLSMLQPEMSRLVRNGYPTLEIGLSIPGALGGDSNDSRSTRLYLPARTWRAPSLSSKAAPTLDLNGSSVV